MLELRHARGKPSRIWKIGIGGVESRLHEVVSETKKNDGNGGQILGKIKETIGIRHHPQENERIAGKKMNLSQDGSESARYRRGLLGLVA